VLIQNADEGQLIKIGPAPKFEFINQDSKKITNET
jgi:protein SCO1/2